MARVVGGIGASHAPSMEHIYDAGEEVRESEEWQPLFGPFKDVASWLEELRPDRLVRASRPSAALPSQPIRDV